MARDSSVADLSSVAENFGPTVNGEKDVSPHTKNEVANGIVNGAVATPKKLAGSIDNAKHIYKGPVDKEGIWTWVDNCPDDVADAAENDETARNALVVRNKKSRDSRKKFEIDSIIIQSPWLKVALTEILKDYPRVCCNLERLVFDAPFEPFVHRWGNFLDFMKKKHDKKTESHLNILYGILKEELRDTIKAFEDYVAHGVITFEHVWTIFQPGALVLSHFHGGTTVAVRFQSGDYDDTGCGKVYSLNCEFIDWDGEKFGVGSENLQVHEFTGIRSIESLHAYPLAFHPRRGTLRNLLLRRGKKFESLTGYHYKGYNGYALGKDSEGKQIRLNVNGRIVIDTESWNRHSRDRERYLEPLNLPGIEECMEHIVLPEGKENEVHGIREVDRKSRVQFQEEHYLICSSRVKGYSLKLKRWLEFYVDLVDDIKWNDHAFQSLVLPEDQKELILSFAESQVTSREDFDDVIHGKGKGIIMLLSGPPGVGKTLTAESVAENMHVPLYTMSAGDLGLFPSQVESTLRTILEMIAKWNAILLLDECDVFLEARSAHHLERNKLVSIFLRMLEYYEGILFLTTNRTENIDAAFQSRIHISMTYPELTPKSRRYIWANFLASSTKDHEFSEKDLDELAEVELNGRQIKNVLKTAHLLASRRKCALRREFVETVLAIEKRRLTITE